MVLSCVQVKQGHIFSNSEFATKYNQSSILFEPPKKLNLMYYRCDVSFCLDPILEMFDDEISYGICLISGEELYVYIANVSDNRFDLKIINKLNIELETRTRRGGSSSARYGRINDKAKNYNKNTFTEMIVSSYMTDNHTKCKIKKLILAGPTDMKKEITETQLFQQHLQKYLFKLINTNGINQTTAHDVMENILVEIKYSNVKDVDNEIENHIKNNYELLAIGRTECQECIDNKNIKKIYVCKSLIQQNQLYEENKINLNSTLEMLDELKKNIRDITIIFSESQVLKTYGGWMVVKKYNII